MKVSTAAAGQLADVHDLAALQLAGRHRSGLSGQRALLADVGVALEAPSASGAAKSGSVVPRLGPEQALARLGSAW